jgi:C1A family cysteine protease
MTRRYGWRPDHPDHRDLVYGAPPLIAFHELPRKVDLRDACPPIQDQGNTQSCTGHMLAFLIHYDRLKEGLEDLPPSRLFPYYNARVTEGSESIDNGAAIRDLIKSVNRQGYCDESLWPFDTKMVTVKPADAAYEQAFGRKISKYERVGQSADLIRSVLAHGRPVGFGVSVFESFESPATASTGIIPMPGKNEGFLGGHAIAIVGYDDDEKVFGFRNSYGIKWGLSGYGTLPYNYVLNPDLANGFWAIDMV